MATDAEIAAQVDLHLSKTSVKFGDYKAKVAAGKYPEFGGPSEWGLARDALRQIGQAPPPPPPPPPDGWVLAAPGSTGQKVTTVAHAPGAAVNLHSSGDPMQVADTLIIGGHDQAFLVQPGAPGRQFLRCEVQHANADGTSVDHDHLHCFYVKAQNTHVFDFKGTGSAQTSNGFSCRFGGFVGQRFDLSGCPEPLGVFADDETPGSIIWRQGKIDGGENIWIDVDEASKMVYQIICGQIVWTNGPSKFIAVNSSTFAGPPIVIEAGCVLNGRPVTPAGLEEFIHAYPSRSDMENETRRSKLPKDAVLFAGDHG